MSLGARRGRRAASALLGGGGGFSPDDVASLIAWWDASDSGTITQTSGLVSAWADKSSAGNDLSASGVDRPTTGTRVINGLNVLDFDGANSRMVTGNVSYGQPVTIFAVVASDDTSAANRQFVANYNNPDPIAYQVDGVWSMYAGTANKSAVSVDTSAHILTVGHQSTGSLGFLRVDGVVALSGVNSGGGSWSASPIALGANSSSSFEWNGRIGEVLIYNALITGGDRGDVEAYLSDKWGVSI